MKTRSGKYQIFEDRENKRRLVLDRKTIAETGFIPQGLMFLSDSAQFEILKTDTVMKESKNGEVPVLRATGLIQKGDTENANTRFYDTRSVLKPAIESIQKDVADRAVLGEYDHPCFMVDSLVNCKVLTTTGWVPYDQIKEGDYVYSRVDGVMVPSLVKSVVNEHYKGKSYRLDGRHISVSLTAPHKMILDTRSDNNNKSRQIEVTLEELANNRRSYDKCRIPRVAEWNGDDKPFYVIKGLPVSEHSSPNDPLYDQYLAETEDLSIRTDLFVAFLGLYLAEGGLHRFGGTNDLRSNRIEISQIKEDYKPQIRDLLNRIFVDKQWSENDTGFTIFDRRLVAYLAPLGNKYAKYIPQDVKNLDAKYLEELVYWYQIGDGRLKHGRSNVFSVSSRLIDDLHECWVKAGHCCYRTIIETAEDYEFAGRIIRSENKKPLHQLTLSYTIGIYCDSRFLDITPIESDGKIWCLTTEFGNFYVENDGCSFWTGNCDAKIHLDRVSHLMSNVWMENNKVYGEIEVLHRLPLGACLRGLFEHKVRVGISSRGVGDMEIAEHKGREVYRVLPGFQFVTWDVVAEPSVNGAILGIKEGLERRIKPLQKNRKAFSPEVYQNRLVEEINKYFNLK